MLTSSIEFVVHLAFIHPYYLFLSHLHYEFWKKNSDIIKGDKDNNERDLHSKNWFQSFGWQYQGVL
jgi:hypothetical protein